MIHAFAASRSRSTRRDGWVRKPPPATMGDYLLGGTALKQAPEHPTSASITAAAGFPSQMFTRATEMSN